MFGIIGGLLGGWILALFGFESIIINGMAQFFGLSINMTGYYFLFAMGGFLRNIFGAKHTIDLKKTFDQKNDNKNKK